MRYLNYKATPEFRYDDPTDALMRITFDSDRGITCTSHRVMGETAEEFIINVFNEFCVNWSDKQKIEFRDRFIDYAKSLTPNNKLF